MSEQYYPRCFNLNGIEIDLGKVVLVGLVRLLEKGWVFDVWFGREFTVQTSKYPTNKDAVEARNALLCAWRGGTEEPMEPM